MTIRELYDLIKTNAEAVTGVASVGFYNDDIARMSEGDVLPLPRVSVEFQNIRYNTESQKQTSSEILVILQTLVPDLL